MFHPSDPSIGLTFSKYKLFKHFRNQSFSGGGKMCAAMKK